MTDLDKLLALLKESKREHTHCDDSWYCCGACRHPDHTLVEIGDCTCGAAEWNAKVDKALREFGPAER